MRGRYFTPIKQKTKHEVPTRGRNTTPYGRGSTAATLYQIEIQEKETSMDYYRLREIAVALNNKNVSQPCPRCSSKNFSVVGESEINVIQPTIAKGMIAGLSTVPVKTTIPIIIVTCDNCGFIAQHAQAPLGLYKERVESRGMAR